MVLKRLVSVVAFLVWALPAAAVTPAEQVLAALEAKGYVVIVQERTWLGRLRIVAVNGDLRRELVINPGTGEILRDFAELRWNDSNEAKSSGTTQVTSGAVAQPVVPPASVPTVGVTVGVAAGIAAGQEPPPVTLTAPLVLTDPIVVGGN